MKVIIVDDEPKAISLLTSYLAHFSNYNLIGSFRNGLKALEFINSNKIEVVFLDINMPHLNGLSLSKMIPKETAIVFTTAYSEHAVESYNVNAIDYLLKPISLERFSKSIAKITENYNSFSNTKTNVNHQDKRLFIKSGLDIHQISVNDIQYLKKDGNYIYYFVSDKKIMARESIRTSLSKLPDYFIQIQKSYIVNVLKISIVKTNFVYVNDVKIPIGFQFKTHLLNILNQN